jgi:hypothetical protein
LIPKTEQVEINRKRRADEIIKKNNEHAKHKNLLPIGNISKFDATEFIKKEVVHKIDYNESHGVVPERSFSRMRRLRSVFVK